MHYRLATLFSALVLVLVAGCDLPPPYVYIEDEFNRESATFGKMPKDIESVSVCYNSRGTQAKTVSDLAQAECAKFDKNASYLRQDYQRCPMMTPARAVYACVKR